MKSLFTALSVLCLPLLLTAQYGVSGYIHLNQLTQSAHTISLYKLSFEEDVNTFKSVPIATTQLGEDGYFSFSGTLFTPEDGIYKIQLDDADTALDSEHYHLFIHSNTDSLYFDRTNQDFEAYLSSNLADWEWRKLRSFSEDNGQKPLQLQEYVRDSLQILLVKLIGLKQLEDKQLLAKEIEMNPAYYADLVNTLQESGLPPSDYAFLSSHYMLITHQATTRKYHLSLLLNGLALLIILGLMGYVIITKRKQAATSITATLSKQEQLVRQLILSGKSNKEIAAELFVSVHTVKSHITNLYSKLGVKSRKELLAR